MMGKMDEETLQRLKKKDYAGHEHIDFDEDIQRSKYIISPNNFWNLQRNILF